MTCKLSDKCDNVFACNILRPNVELLGCNFYKPKKPMTNEEWLKSMNTEQLAEILVYMAEDKSETKTVHKENVGKCVWWLKQPHTNE